MNSKRESRKLFEENIVKKFRRVAKENGLYSKTIEPLVWVAEVSDFIWSCSRLGMCGKDIVDDLLGFDNDLCDFVYICSKVANSREEIPGPDNDWL